MFGDSSLRGNPYGRHCGGFTLVELIISIVLLGILATVGSSMIVDSFTTTRIVNADNASVGQARYALERLAREIREIKYVGSGTTGNYSITTPSPLNPSSTLVFTKSVSGADVTVTITRSGANLTLGYSSPALTSTLSNLVSSFTLTFLPVSGTTTPDTRTIRFVVIELSVTDPPTGQSILQRTRVALRNA